MCALTLVGSALYSLFAPPLVSPLDAVAGKRAVVEGTVVRDPDVREGGARITLRPERANGTALSDTPRVLVLADRFAGVAYGDRVRVVGTLEVPESFETDSGRTFDYPKYLRAHGISHAMSFASVEVLETGQGNPTLAFLLSIKHALIDGIEMALPEPSAALAEGLLLGEKQSLGARLFDAFTAAGVVHIIVLSGYNVALVIESVLFIALRMLPHFLAYTLAALFVVAFALMTGASETTIRATIMALFMMMARVLRRPSAALRGLFIAAALMAVVNPFLVLYDLSFQLSVLATLGLILFSDGVAKRLRFIPERLGLREIVATTLATQVTVLPILILSVGALSLVFLPANALILPVVPFSMLLSFIAALVAIMVPSFALAFGFVAYLPLGWIIGVAEFFGTLPFATIAIPPSLAWWVLGVLLLLYVIFGLRIARKLPPR